MLYSWISITASQNRAGRHTGVSAARDMPYGLFLKGSPRHRSHWIPTRVASILSARRGSGTGVDFGLTLNIALTNNQLVLKRKEIVLYSSARNDEEKLVNIRSYSYLSLIFLRHSYLN
ncbi:hypothetical protein EVAR_39922_1 [Eumeta japonica]|uniref:Uncharacterized protein n=1 Tax=Eumeta variegata TaxID=151549 RepID=A0A4C1WN66_EUMVA|nr:hypothetical protein EVAR_39922_1 [Eumeta japonica]